MKLNEIIREEQDDLVKKFRSLYDTLELKRQDWAIKSLETLQRGVEAGMIYNADFGEARDVLKRAYENTVNKLDDNKDEIFRKLYVDYGYSSHYSELHSSGSYVRVLEKAIKERVKGEATPEQIKKIEKQLEIHRVALELKQIFDKLKPKIVKGRKPSAASLDPDRFHQRLGNKEAQTLVTAEIKKGIDPRLDEFETGMRKYFQKTIDELKTTGEYKAARRGADPFTVMIIQRCFKSKNQYTREFAHYTELEITETGKKFPETEARSQREFIEDGFLAKSVQKLSHLVELKGNLDKITELPKKPVSVRAGAARIEAGFKFTFTDGSHFTVINKIVSKYSYRGHPFTQFPTTFHDVTFPDGSKLKLPSEEKMVKEFGTWRKSDEAA